MATIEDAPIDTNYNYNDQETQELGNRSNQQGPGGADGYFPASQSSDGGREARIALRKARIEANRIARFRPSDNDGLIFLGCSYFPIYRSFYAPGQKSRGGKSRDKQGENSDFYWNEAYRCCKSTFYLSILFTLRQL